MSECADGFCVVGVGADAGVGVEVELGVVVRGQLSRAAERIGAAQDDDAKAAVMLELSSEMGRYFAECVMAMQRFEAVHRVGVRPELMFMDLLQGLLVHVPMPKIGSHFAVSLLVAMVGTEFARLLLDEHAATIEEQIGEEHYGNDMEMMSHLLQAVEIFNRQ